MGWSRWPARARSPSLGQSPRRKRCKPSHLGVLGRSSRSRTLSVRSLRRSACVHRAARFSRLFVLQLATDELASLLGKADGRRLVSVTVEADIADPSAAVFASRLAGDRWFCWEQPDRGGFALAGLGSVAEAVGRGPSRFADVGSRIAELDRGRVAAEPAELPAGARPGWVGGFAFDP